MTNLVPQNPVIMGYNEANQKMAQISMAIDTSIAELKERFIKLSQDGLQENQETLDRLITLWREAKAISDQYKPELEKITRAFYELHRAAVGERDRVLNRPLNELREINEAVNKIADAIERARKEAARKLAEEKRAEQERKQKELDDARKKEEEKRKADEAEKERKEKEEKEKKSAVDVELVEEKIDINQLIQEKQAEADRSRATRDAQLIIDQKTAELTEAARQSQQAALIAQAPVAPVIQETITYDIKLEDPVPFCQAIASGELLGTYRGRPIFELSTAGIKGIVLGRADMQPKPSRPGDSVLDGLRKYGLLITAKAERKIK